MGTAIFLGAGASSAEGAPIQSNLFRDYFKSLPRTPPVREMDRELATFFDSMFGIDVDERDKLDQVSFPTFEEALGILDLAERRKEALKEFDLDNMARNSNRIRFIRQYLVMLMAKIVHDKLLSSGDKHQKLVRRILKAKRIKETVFVSTNYDILIDNALTALYSDGILLDYGVDFTNFDKSDDWQRPKDPAVRLFKLHGSLNWLYCPTCNTLTLTPKDKGIIRLLTDFSKSACSSCESVIVPIVVPPTYYKDMSNVFLSLVWHKTEQALRKVDRILFCGYSFPDADIHIKYLIKRIQTNRDGRLKISVFNNHPGKDPRLAKEEELRYKRFLGAQVEYTDKSFDDLVKDPVRYM